MLVNTFSLRTLSSMITSQLNALYFSFTSSHPLLPCGSLHPLLHPWTPCLQPFIMYLFLNKLSNLCSNRRHFSRWVGDGSPHSAWAHAVSTSLCSSFSVLMNTQMDGWRLETCTFHM